VSLYVSHSPHIRRELKYHVNVAADGFAIAALPKINDARFDVGRNLMPCLHRFVIRRTHACNARFQKGGDQVSANKAARATD
jgi:hypothetical protein